MSMSFTEQLPTVDLCSFKKKSIKIAYLSSKTAYIPMLKYEYFRICNTYYVFLCTMV